MKQKIKIVMDREKNKIVHNSYWNNVLKIIKDVNPLKVSLENLCFFITYCEIQKNFSLNVNTFDINVLNDFVISNGYKPEYKSKFKQFCKQKKEIISNEIPKNVTKIIDLGSGWGRYSILLSKEFPNSLIYSLENSEVGVECCNLIKKKYGLDNLICERFDYYEPDSLEKIAVVEKDTLFYFSSFSIEQIPYINEKLFKIILKTECSSICGFHIEPIGWQVNKKKKNTSERYNNDLFFVLNKFQDKEKIQIIKIDVDIYGKQSNPGTIIKWKKR